MQAHSTANGKIRREIQNPQMFETDPESFFLAIYFTAATATFVNYFFSKRIFMMLYWCFLITLGVEFCVFFNVTININFNNINK
jgi:hypothetical protein